MDASGPAKTLTKNDQVVYDVVSAQVPGRHASAQDVYAEAKLRQPAIGYSTVYRALDRLCAQGLVHEVQVSGAAAALYEPARHGHAHFLCTGCGRVEDIDYDVPPADIFGLNAALGIAIAGVALTFNGLCRACGDRSAASVAKGA